MVRKIDVKEGDRYGMLTVIKEVYGRSRRSFLCKCDCGNIKSVMLNTLRNCKKSVSCGCYLQSKVTKHGFKGTRQYSIWQGIKNRCNNKRELCYKYYGGRGITYDAKRETFEGFWEDMEEGYSNDLTIDRIDNDKEYTKGNCRRSTRKEQARNRSTCFYYKGITIAEWADKWGVSHTTASRRVKDLL